VLQIIPNDFLSVLLLAVANDQVSCGSNADLVGNMTRQDKLTIIPAGFNLITLARLNYFLIKEPPVDLHVSHECTSHDA